MKKVVFTDKAPAAIGPYSQAIETRDTVYVSGQLPIDPLTGQFPSDDIKEQTKASLNNIQAILNQLGLSLEHVVKTTVYLDDIQDFAPMNEVYGTYFSAPYPARAAFAVDKLPKGAKVEIEVVAEKELA